MHLSDHSHFSSAALANVLHRSPSPCRLIFDVTELAQRAPQKIRGGKRPNPRQRCEEVANYYHVGLQRKAWHKAINSYQGEPLELVRAINQSCTFHSRCIWRKIYRCVIIELWWPYNYTCWLQQAPATHPLHNARPPPPLQAPPSCRGARALCGGAKTCHSRDLQSAAAGWLQCLYRHPPSIRWIRCQLFLAARLRLCYWW